MPVLARKIKTRKNLKEEIDFELEQEVHRLDQEMIKLKRAGVISKKRKLLKSDVRNLAMIIGIEKLKTLSYQEFWKRVQEMQKMPKRGE